LLSIAIYIKDVKIHGNFIKTDLDEILPIGYRFQLFFKTRGLNLLNHNYPKEWRKDRLLRLSSAQVAIRKKNKDKLIFSFLRIELFRL